MTDLDKAKAMKLKIHSRDRCENCGHWSGDAEQPFRIYSEARAKWLEKAVEIAIDQSVNSEGPIFTYKQYK